MLDDNTEEPIVHSEQHMKNFIEEYIFTINRAYEQWEALFSLAIKVNGTGFLAGIAYIASTENPQEIQQASSILYFFIIDIFSYAFSIVFRAFYFEQKELEMRIFIKKHDIKHPFPDPKKFEPWTMKSLRLAAGGAIGLSTSSAGIGLIKTLIVVVTLSTSSTS